MHNTNDPIKISKEYSIEKAKTIWCDISNKSANNSFSSSWEWTEKWIELFGQQNEYFFLIGTHREQAIGILFFARNRKYPFSKVIRSYCFGPCGEPFKHHVGIASGRIMVIEDFRIPFIKDIVDFLISDKSWDELLFESYSQKDILQVEEVLRLNNLNYLQWNRDYIYSDLDILKNTNKSVLESLSYDLRYQIRRSTRALEDELIGEWAETEQQSNEFVDEMISMHQSRWRAKGWRGSFESTLTKNFIRSIFPKLIAQGKAGLYRVKCNKHGTIACLSFFIDEGVIYGFQSGIIDPEKLNVENINKKRLKPGFIAHTMCMQECLNRRYKIYSFGSAETNYKRELAKQYKTEKSILVYRNYKSLFYNKFVKISHQLRVSPLTLKMSKLINK